MATFDAHANFAYSLVAVAPSPATSGVTLEVTPGTGSRFPAAPFNVTMWPPNTLPLASNAEIGRITSKGTGDNWTLIRAAEPNADGPSVAKAVAVGWQIAETITAKVIDDLQTAMEAQVNSLGISTQGNTLGTTGYATGTAIRYLFVGGNNITLSQSLVGSLATLTISGPNAAGAQTGISAIIAGTGTATSGTISFADASGVTFGLDGQTLTASVRTDYQSSGDYLTTAMASNRGSDFVQATAVFNGTNVTGTIASNAISVSVAAQSVQPQSNQTLGLYLSSNTTLTSSGTFDARSFSVRAVGSLTAGYSAGELVLSAPNALTTAMASNRGSDFVQATAAFAGTNATGTIASNGISVSVDATVAQSNQTLGLYASSNTYLTSSGTVDARSLSFRGDQSITVGISSGQVAFSVGAYLTTARRSTDAIGLNTAQTNVTWTVNSSGISLNAGGYAGTGFTSATTAGTAVVGTQNTAGLSLGVPAFLTTARGSTDAVGLNTAQTNVTWTVNSSGISLNAGGYAGTGFTSTTTAGTEVKATNNTAGLSMAVPAFLTTQSAQFLALTLAGNSLGTSTFHASNNASLFFHGGQGITLSGNGSSVTWSVGSYITTARASTDAIGLNTAKTNVTWTVNSSGISLDAGGYAGTGFTSTSTAGVDIKATNNTSGLSMAVPAFLTTAMASNRGSDFVQATAVFNGTNATGTIASGAISVSVAAPIPIATSVNPVASASSVGTVTRYAPEDHRHAGIGAVGISTSGNTAGTTGSVQGTYWFQGGANLTVSQITSNNGSHTLVFSGATAAPSPVIISAGTSTGSLSSIVFSDSNGISFGLNGSTITGTVSTYSTVGTATTAYSVASANSVGTVTRWAAEDHRHAGVGGIGISTGNTSGTSGSVLGTYWLAGSNAISVSQITSNNGSHTLNIVGPPHLSYFKLAELAQNTHTTSVAQSTSVMAPFVLPWNHSFDRLRVMVSAAGAASSTQATTGNTSLSMSGVTSNNIVIYSRGTGASSLSLQYVTSTQVVDQCLMTISYNANSTQYSVSLRFTFGNTSFTKDYSVSSGTVNWHTSNLTDLTGVKYLDLPMGLSLAPGQYWIGYGRSTTNATQNGSISVATRMLVSMNSMIAISQNTLPLGMLGGATNSSVGFYPALGSYTTGGAAGTTASVEMSAVSTNVSNNIFHMQMMRIV